MESMIYVIGTLGIINVFKILSELTLFSFSKTRIQQIARDLEAKYLAEHERVRLWHEENDRL